MTAEAKTRNGEQFYNVSEYEEEAFANCFSMYCHNKDELSIEVIQFIEELGKLTK